MSAKDACADAREEWAVHTTTLRHLALTCRDFHEAAIEALYCSVRIWQGASAARLLHTLMRRPDLRQHIHELQFVKALDETFEEQCYKAFKLELKWSLASMSLFERAVFRLGLCETVTRLHWYGHGLSPMLAASMLTALLCLVPGLRTFSLRVPSANDTKMFECLQDLLDKVYADEFANTSPRFPEPEIYSGSLRRTTMPMLSTLAITKAATKRQMTKDSHWISLIARFSQSGIRQLQLNAIDLELGDSGSAESIHDLADPGPEAGDMSKTQRHTVNWRELDTLQISHTRMTGDMWYQACNLFTNLRSLDISVAQLHFGSPNGGSGDTRASREYLNSGLLQLCDTLERLRVRTRHIESYITEVGPQGTLSCLPKLTRLACLDIPILLIFNNPIAMIEAKVRQVLPTSLKSLVLREVWSRRHVHEILKDVLDWEAYGATVVGFLKSIVRTEQTLPSLTYLEFHEQWEFWRAKHANMGMDLLSGERVTFTAFDLQDRPISLSEPDDRIYLDLKLSGEMIDL